MALKICKIEKDGVVTHTAVTNGSHCLVHKQRPGEPGDDLGILRTIRGVGEPPAFLLAVAGAPVSEVENELGPLIPLGEYK